jgi:hydroxymethylpyrimidine pyrophosphatase-like HAD family hydrolase
MFLDQFKDDDWEASEYYQDFKAFFPWISDFLISEDPYNLYFHIPRDLFDKNVKDIINHVKNNEKRLINGKTMKAKTVITSQGSKEIRPLEIIPKFAGKGLAARYAQWILGFADCDTFTAGDSLNDRDALKIQVRGVLVGNAEERLVEWFSKKQRNHLLYSSQKYAHGVIDLLCSFHLNESFQRFLFIDQRCPRFKF